MGVVGASAGMKARTEDWQMAQRRLPDCTTDWDGLAEAWAQGPPGGAVVGPGRGR